MEGESHLVADIQAAVEEWNRVLDDPRTPNVPHFRYSPPAESTAIDPDLWVRQNGTGSMPCGYEQDGIITLHSDCGPGSHSDTPARMLIHELTAPLGFQEAMESQGVAGVSDHCVNVLPTTGGGVNATICQHELEIVRQAYGYGGPIDGQVFMGKHVLTGLLISPGSVSFTALGQTQQLSVIEGVFANGNLSLVENEPTVAVTWSSTIPSVASVDQVTGLVTSGTSPGSTLIKATASSLPSNVVASEFPDPAEFRVPVTLTLPPPPPPGPLRVTNITGIAAPITTSGPKLATAHVSGVPSGALLQVSWRIIYSIGSDGTGPDTVWTNWGGVSRSFPVHFGNYHLSLMASPRASRPQGGYDYGAPYVADYPVCTESGPLRVKGPPTTQRPQGC